jgi:hypothetical protein
MNLLEWKKCEVREKGKDDKGEKSITEEGARIGEN